MKTFYKEPNNLKLLPKNELVFFFSFEHNVVEFFYDRVFFSQILLQKLKQFPDVQRSLQRLTMNKGTPADICAICRGITVAQNLEQLLLEDNSNFVLFFFILRFENIFFCFKCEIIH
jgi:DNA mismatch repair ATPase MutS